MRVQGCDPDGRLRHYEEAAAAVGWDESGSDEMTREHVEEHVRHRLQVKELERRDRILKKRKRQHDLVTRLYRDKPPNAEVLKSVAAAPDDLVSVEYLNRRIKEAERDLLRPKRPPQRTRDLAIPRTNVETEPPGKSNAESKANPQDSVMKVETKISDNPPQIIYLNGMTGVDTSNLVKQDRSREKFPQELKIELLEESLAEVLDKRENIESAINNSRQELALEDRNEKDHALNKEGMLDVSDDNRMGGPTLDQKMQIRKTATLKKWEKRSRQRVEKIKQEELRTKADPPKPKRSQSPQGIEKSVQNHNQPLLTKESQGSEAHQSKEPLGKQFAATHNSAPQPGPSEGVARRSTSQEPNQQRKNSVNRKIRSPSVDATNLEKRGPSNNVSAISEKPEKRKENASDPKSKPAGTRGGVSVDQKPNSEVKKPPTSKSEGKIQGVRCEETRPTQTRKTNQPQQSNPTAKSQTKVAEASQKQPVRTNEAPKRTGASGNEPQSARKVSNSAQPTARSSNTDKNSAPQQSAGFIDKIKKFMGGNEEEPMGSDTEDESSGVKYNVINGVRPVNVENEKSKFFKSKFDYNPTFRYHNPLPDDVLQKYGSASDKYLPHSIRIMKFLIRKYGSYENFEATTGGRVLTREEIIALVRDYCRREKFLDGEIVLNLSEDLLSTASMTRSSNQHGSHGILSVRPGDIHESWIEGLLRHELSTHYIRGSNNQLQPWARVGDRKKYKMLPHNPTEEGLASLHTVLLRQDPLLFRNALLYFSIAMAARLSFKDLFMKLGEFVHEPGRRWEYCMRAKRGQVDTSKPGCFAKDQVYLTGALNILKHRKSIDFHALMKLGKVAFEDVDRLKKAAGANLQADQLRIPSFMVNMKQYRARMDHILKANGLSDNDFKKDEKKTSAVDECRYDI